MCNRRGGWILPFLLLFFSVGAEAQTNISGKPGLIYIPSATLTEDGTLRMGANYNPVRYGFRRRGRNPERIIFANLTILPRLDVNVNLLQLISTNQYPVKEALGDRQLDLRYVLLKETAKRPSLAVVLSSPFTIDAALLTHVVVATKTFQLSPELKAIATLGLGSPYFVYRNESNLANSNIFSKFTWQKKSETRYANQYLEGPFGGLQLQYRNKVGLMVEYDTPFLNVGAYAHLFRHWTVQAGLLNGDQVTVGTSYAFELLKPSKRAKKAYETAR